MNKPNPDNRSDNASKIKKNISSTKSQMEAGEEMMAATDNEQTKRELKAKNKRRKNALEGLETELKQEQEYNKNHSFL